MTTTFLYRLESLESLAVCYVCKWDYRQLSLRQPTNIPVCCPELGAPPERKPPSCSAFGYGNHTQPSLLGEELHSACMSNMLHFVLRPRRQHEALHVAKHERSDS